MGQLDTLLGKSAKTQTASSGGSLDSLIKGGIKTKPTPTPTIAPQPVAKKEEPVQTPKSVWSNITSAVSIALNRGSNAQSKVSNKELSKNEEIGATIGRKLQKIPNADLGTKGQKLFKSTDTETKIVNFISNFPSAIAQSTGQTLEQLSTQGGRDKLKSDAKNLPNTMSEVKTLVDNKEWQKALETAMSNSAFTIGLDIAGFIPVTKLVKVGVKGFTAERKVAETVIKEVIAESEKVAVKTVAKKEVVKVAETVKPKVEKPVVAPKSSKVVPATQDLFRGTKKESKAISSIKYDDYGEGVYVTSTKENAKVWGDTVHNLTPAKDLNMLDVANPEGKQVFDSVRSKYTASEVITSKEIPTVSKSVSADLEKLGYDGIDFGTTRKGNHGDEMVIFNEKNVQVKNIKEVNPQVTELEPKKVSVPREQLPVKQGQSRVFERLQKENPEQLTGELPYDKAILKKEFDNAASNIAKNKQKAYETAMGRQGSSDLESVATNIEMAEKALQEGNTELYSKLVRNRSIAQTRRGQAIVAEKASIEDNSTARYVKELLSSRLENLGKKYLSGLKEGNTIKKHATEIIDKKVDALEITIKRGKLDTKTALKLLDELTCV